MKTYTEEEVKKLTNEAHNSGFILGRSSNGVRIREDKKLDHLRFDEWWKNNKKNNI